MKKAKFKYQIVEHKSHRVLLIEDTKGLFENCRTVITDILSIIDHIEMVEKIKAEHFIVLLKGTSFTWDAWCPRTGEFAGLSKKDWPATFQAYIFSQLQTSIQ
jgi:hypothetical protein